MAPKGVVLSHFGLEMGIDLYHVGLKLDESRMV